MFTIEEFKLRYNNTEMEMVWSFVVNTFFSLASMVPILYTGTIMVGVFIYIFYLVSDFNIKKRHNFLTSTFGAKPEEDRSLNNSNILVMSASVSMVILSIMEFIVYFYLYNKKVFAIIVGFLSLNFFEVPSLGKNNHWRSGPAGRPGLS